MLPLLNARDTDKALVAYSDSKRRAWFKHVLSVGGDRPLCTQNQPLKWSIFVYLEWRLLTHYR